MAQTFNAVLTVAVMAVVLVALLGTVEGRLCYKPQARPQSNCCSQCSNYGCLVNGGTLTEHTPCNPTDPNNPTWMFCDKTGCDGSCGSCSCQGMGYFQKKAVQYDLSHGALFYAFRKGENTALMITCSQCGNGDKSNIDPNTIPLETCPVNANPLCRGDGSRCSEDYECCGSDICKGTEFFGQGTCEPCYQSGTRCSSSSDCCGNLRCRSKRLGPKRCR